jgi:dienelactone hydrolase
MFSEVSRRLAKEGFLVATAELSGNPGQPDSTAGKFSVAEHLQDYREIVNFLRQHPGVDPNRMVLHGHSYSAFMVAHELMTLKPAVAVLQAPVIYPEAWLDTPRREFPSREFRDFRYSRHLPGEDPTLAAVKRFTDGRTKGHMLLITHEFDEYVAPNITNSFKRSANSMRSRVAEIPDAQHMPEFAEWDRMAGRLTREVSRSLSVAVADRATVRSRVRDAAKSTQVALTVTRPQTPQVAVLGRAVAQEPIAM